jgi:DNA-directed RNA polymerase specialized sigma24 family protein
VTMSPAPVVAEHTDDGRTDVQVIAAARGAPARFAVIFDRHFVTVHRYLACRVGDALADDLASETFATALGHLRSYDDAHASARPWLLGIATNLLRHHRREEARLLRALVRTGTAAAVDHAEDLAAHVARRGQRSGRDRRRHGPRQRLHHGQRGRQPASDPRPAGREAGRRAGRAS